MMSARQSQAIGRTSVAIVGAGGFLGTNLALRLAPSVGALRCYGRRCSFPEAMCDLVWVAGDINDKKKVSAAIRGCDTVIHLASTSTPFSADSDIPGDAQANIVGTLNLLDCCVLAGVKRVVFVSSGGTVYGIPSIVPTPEDAPATPVTAYGVTKLAIEKYLNVYSRLRGLEYRVLRVSNIYGPFQTAEKKQGVIAAFLRRAVRGMPLEIWGDGKVVRDYVFVNDVVDAIECAIAHNGQARVFNVGSGSGLSLLQVIDAIEVLIGRRLERDFYQGRPVDVPISVLDCTLATKELGWVASTEFRDGLMQTLNWVRNHVARETTSLAVPNK